MGFTKAQVIEAPSGRFVMVGRVPAQLAYVALDGADATDEQLAKAASYGPRLAGVKTRTWATKAEALAALAALA